MTSLELAPSVHPDPSEPTLPRVRAQDMTPGGLAGLQPSRMSVSRLLMARAIREKWRIEKVLWEIDEQSAGRAVYHIDTGSMIFSFAILSFTPTSEGKTGRIIGRSWDMMGALTEGQISDVDLATLAVELPKLYEGRATPGSLIWARANRSSRAFDHTVDALAAGHQPDVGVLSEVCYLMRNTGLDGNGTFGTRSFLALENDHPLKRPLDAQMLSAYMMRVFSIDLAQHLANARNPDAPLLDPAIQRYLGVGNGSALGLILFVNNHPQLIHNWLSARQEAIEAACSLTLAPDAPELSALRRMLERTITFRQQDRMEYERFADSGLVARELQAVLDRVVAYQQGTITQANGLAQLADWTRDNVHRETYQTVLGILTELVPEVCDAQADHLSAEEDYSVIPDMSAATLRDLLRREYGWAFDMDLDREDAQRHIWYKSVSAEEPRRGPASEVDYAFNLGLDLPRHIRALDRMLADQAATTPVAECLLAHPQHRMLVARVQTLSGLDAHSPHMDIMDDRFVPVDIVRLMNVGLHGVDKARDYLGRNLRGVLFHGAPTPHDIAQGENADWFFPEEPR